MQMELMDTPVPLNKYEAFGYWIEWWDAQRYLNSNVTRDFRLRAHCVDWSEKLAQEFPELKVVKGFVRLQGAGHWYDENRPGAEHAWCVAPDGEIVDITRGQFVGWNNCELFYTPLQENKHLVYVGKCPNCGTEQFGTVEDGPKDFCDEQCQEEYGRYVTNSARNF